MRSLLPPHVAALVLSMLAFAACDRSHALGIRPDVSATWDVMQDDVIHVEVRVGGEVHRARVMAEGGELAFHDAGSVIELEIDCKRPELICPHELLPRELELDNRMGDMNDDGDQLALSFAGEGEGPCQLRRGSVAKADVSSHGSPASGDWTATMLTGGTASVVIGGGCFANQPGLPAGAEVVLSSGFTAARR